MREVGRARTGMWCGGTQVGKDKDANSGDFGG